MQPLSALKHLTWLAGSGAALKKNRPPPQPSRKNWWNWAIAGQTPALSLAPITSTETLKTAFAINIEQQIGPLLRAKLQWTLLLTRKTRHHIVWSISLWNICLTSPPRNGVYQEKVFCFETTEPHLHETIDLDVHPWKRLNVKMMGWKWYFGVTVAQMFHVKLRAYKYLNGVCNVKAVVSET